MRRSPLLSRFLAGSKSVRERACTAHFSRGHEAINGTGDGNTSPDWQVVDAHHVKLRAERAGNGSGRTYTLTVTCTDAAGNRTVRTATVLVPHDQR